MRRLAKQAEPRVRIHSSPPASLQFSGFSHHLREKRAFGRNPALLAAQALRTGRFDIPVDWAAQSRALVFSQPP